MMAFNTNYKDTGLFGVYAIAKVRSLLYFISPKYYLSFSPDFLLPLVLFESNSIAMNILLPIIHLLSID